MVRMRLIVAGTKDRDPASVALTVARTGDRDHANALLISLDAGAVAQEIVSDGRVHGTTDLAQQARRGLRLALRQRVI